jgi:hypothetical protein
MQSRRSFLHLGVAAAATLIADRASAAHAAAHAAAYHGSARGGGTITAIDQAARTFTCVRRRRGRRAWTYHTNDNTQYRAGREQASWSDLTVGAVVQVRWHHAGGQRVADLVVMRARPS